MEKLQPHFAVAIHEAALKVFTFVEDELDTFEMSEMNY